MVTDDPLSVLWGIQELPEVFSRQSALRVDRTSVQAHDHTLTEYVRPGESFTIRGFSSVENDEVIAHALQEELANEASDKPPEWSSPSAADCDYDSEQESDDDGLPDMSDDSANYDGEVGKRLTHMGSIPHVPKINGEIPTVDEVSATHQRLLDRLKEYGLMELKVDGDGNCQFRAFSDQLYRTPSHHKSVRDDVVTQLTSYPDYYEGYVPMTYVDYVKKMAKSGEWGDHVTLQAGADFYGVTINLLTSFKDTSFVQISPRQPKSNRVIHLSFWAEVHYNSIYALGEIPRRSGIRKKGKHLKRYLADKLKI